MKGISVALRSQNLARHGVRSRRSARNSRKTLTWATAAPLGKIAAHPAEKGGYSGHGRPKSLRLMEGCFRMSEIPTMIAEPQHVHAAPPHSDPYPYYGR